MLDFFDCNVILGKVHKPGPGGILDEARLLREMDRYGIADSLVYHVYGRRSAPPRGNELASAATQVSPRLHACWVLMPTITAEMPPLEIVGEEMRRANVRAVRLFPDAGGHFYTLSEPVCGELFDWLEARRLPVFLEQTTLAWRDLDDVMERHPNLHVVLVDLTYRVNRDLYPRLKAYPTLAVETSYLQQHRGIEDICERFGAKRLIFGSKIPFLCPGSARHMIEKAGIDEKDKSRIAGANLRELLAGVRW